MKKLLTKKNLIAWLETLDSEKPFEMMNNYTCIFASFIQANGYPKGTCSYSRLQKSYDSKPFLVPLWVTNTQDQFIDKDINPTVKEVLAYIISK